MSVIIQLWQDDAGVCGDPVKVGGDSCHHGRVATFAARRAVADEADNRQSVVDVQVHATARVTIARWTASAGNANVGGVEVAVVGVVDVDAVLITDNWQRHKA